MRQRWTQLTFLHWRFDPADVQALLPAGLSVETYDGTAWVGLVPFVMEVATPGGRTLPWLSRFCETNVRTYVHDDAGLRGIWFFSLDATRLVPVLTARTTYWLPYFWSSMHVHDEGGVLDYAGRRRLRRPSVRSRVRVRPGDRFQPDELGDLDHFLTARWRLFSVVAGRLMMARAEHEPWPLHRGDVVRLDDEFVAAAGLPRPAEPPLVHFSPGVSVRISRPERR